MMIIDIAIIHSHIWICAVINNEPFFTSVTAPPKKPADPAGGPGRGKKKKKKNTIHVDNYLFVIFQYVRKNIYLFFYLGNIYLDTF